MCDVCFSETGPASIPTVLLLMTSNPYAQMGNQGGFGTPGGFGGGSDFLEPVQSRTSVLAILSLVFALICFIPGSGALAVIFGGAAVLFISTSNGRLRGMGLAITGIVLGLLFSLLWVFMVVGAAQAANTFSCQFVKPADTVMAAIQKGDYKTARTAFTPTADKVITDEMMADFAKRYQAEMGGYKNAPQTLWELIAAYGAVGNTMNGKQGNQATLPVPGHFEKGTAIVLLYLDPAGMPQSGSSGGNNAFQFPVANIGVMTPGGKEVWLVDQKDTDKLLAPAPSIPDMDAPDKGDPAADAPEVPSGTDTTAPKKKPKF
jgi:hypothetical protein